MPDSDPAPGTAPPAAAGGGRAVPLLVVAVLAWAGAQLATRGGPAATAEGGGAQPAAPPRAEGGGGTPAARKAAAPATDRLSRLYGELLGLTVEGDRQGDADADTGPSIEQVRQALDSAGYRREYLVALVPDPLDTNLANNFDLALDALRRAFTAHGYLPDRAYLPWIGDDAKDHRYRSEPGILLFRRAKMEPQEGTDEEVVVRRLASLLLVGERPKTGIHPAAFRTAAAMLRARGAGTHEERPLQIIGPSFSGSAESLRLALEQSPGLHVQIVTGTATAGGLEEVLGRQPEAAGPTQLKERGTVSFCRTVFPDAVLQAAAWRFFGGSLRWNLRRIALLVEEDTAYGGQAVEPGTGPEPLLVRFPSGLTEVRKLWETTRQQPATKAAPLPGVPAPQELSELSLADPSTPADLGSEFDPVTTRTKELMIANLLEEVPRHGVRYVGIVATDTRDKLYLTERMHGFAPGAILFAFENHLVQAHPRFVSGLQPVLLVGNFPTVTEHPGLQPDLKGPPGRYLRQFGAEFHQGVYRAAELLVARQTGEPAELAAPRVWITVAARGAILPVAAIEPVAPRACFCPAPSVRAEEPRCGARLPSLGAGGYLIVALAIGLLLALGVVLHWKVPPGASTAAPFLVALGTAAVWFPATALCLVAFYVPGFWKEPCLQGTPLLVFGLWLAVLLPFAALTALLVLGVGRLAARPALGWTVGALLPLALFALLVLPFLPALAAGGTYLEYLHLRNRYPMSGVSPLPPLLFLGLAGWVWARLEMQRLRQRARFEVDWPILRSTDPPLAGCAELARRVARRTGELLPASWKFWSILGLALLLPALTLLRAIQPIVEPRAYGWVLLLLVLGLFLLAAISFLRFVRIWRHLERLLDRFEHSALCAALAAVGKEVGWKPISSFSWRMPTFRLLVHSARKLAAVEEQSTVDLTGEGIVSLDAVLTEFFLAEQAGDVEREILARRKLRKAFAAAVERVDPDSQEPAVTAFLAVRVVAYLRYVFLHLRQSLVAAVATWLFLLLAVTTYAFEPQRWVQAGLWLVLGVASVVTLWSFVQMDRNAILSQIGDGQAGRVNFTRPFVLNALTYGLAPLAAVAISIFPELGRHLGRWTDPLLRLLGGS